jgi:hypothetical protein
MSATENTTEINTGTDHDTEKKFKLSSNKICNYETPKKKIYIRVYTENRNSSHDWENIYNWLYFDKCRGRAFCKFRKLFLKSISTR